MYFEELSFEGSWRRYQRAAIAAFERDRAAGVRRTHVVAPPGSGKTLLGVELVRRVGRRALVLAPDTGVQMQWPRAVRRFGAPAGTAGPGPAFPIACVSYEGLGQVDDPELALERVGARLGPLRAAGFGTVVLDECHHVATAWGPVVRAVLEELGDVHLIGLTSSPPAGDELYAALLGPVGISVPTPAVVREGHLAPYQELAWLVEPLEEERRLLAARRERFAERVAHLGGDGPLSLSSWAPESPTDLDGWLELLDGYVRRRLRPAGSREAAERRAGVEAALGELGFRLTPDGIERVAWDADRLVTASGAKARGLVEVLAVEREARGDALRALAVCDGERADPALGGLVEPAAGSARHALMAAGGDPRTAPLRPLVVSERGLRCLPADADALLEALAGEAERHLALPEWTAEPDGVLVALRSSGAEWVPRAWVELASRVLESGATGLLIATRGLLGEGWDCPAVNCLVDLTVAGGGAAAAQLRGRSLGLDPADPRKIASNWDVVCAAPDLLRGSADHERFAAGQQHVHAPADDGAIERGPGHAHLELDGSAPPPAGRFAALNAAAAARAAARDEARAHWRVGEPYRDAELRSLLAREPKGDSPLYVSPAASVSQRVPLAAGLGGAAVAVAVAIVSGAAAALAGLLLAPAGLTWAAVRLRRARDRLPAGLPLEGAARAVAGAYAEVGRLSSEAAASLVVGPARESGHRRCLLTEATPDESARFVAALDELVSASGDPRRLIARPLPDRSASAGALLARVLTRRPPFAAVHHAVPAGLDEHPEAFARAWRRHVGPARIVPAGAAPEDGYETLVRDVWV